jgi:hypothetical protein
MLVEPDALPPFSVKGPMPVVGLTPWLLLICGINETSPVGDPLPELTLTVKLIGCPCVNVSGLVAGVVESERVVVGTVKFDFQLLTKLATLTEPNPVAKS